MDSIASIKIGQAQKQATQILKHGWFNCSDIEANKRYKDLVKRIYQLNSEIEAELELSLKTKGEAASDSDASKSAPIDPKGSKQPLPSPKQKHCPKCNVIIPKTWKEHRKPEGCGWVE